MYYIYFIIQFLHFRLYIYIYKVFIYFKYFVFSAASKRWQSKVILISDSDNNSSSELDEFPQKRKSATKHQSSFNLNKNTGMISQLECYIYNKACDIGNNNTYLTDAIS